MLQRKVWPYLNTGTHSTDEVQASTVTAIATGYTHKHIITIITTYRHTDIIIIITTTVQ